MSQFQWMPHCPVPETGASGTITLAHGEGARLSRRLIRDLIARRLHSPKQTDSGTEPDEFCFSDAAVFQSESGLFVFSTDSYTVSPLFFPGGDIGSLAVYGTVNDLTVAGGVARWLTCSLIIEEGLPVAVLEAVLESMSLAAAECGVRLIAGDTKVVGKGAADQLFVNTSGVGEVSSEAPSGVGSIQAGDRIIVSGDIGRHGVAMLCARGILKSVTPVSSDSRSVQTIVQVARSAGGSCLRAMRDATRGGVSAVLHEWAEDSGASFVLIENDLPVCPSVRGACEILGLDPLYIANEGTVVMVVGAEAADSVVSELKSIPGCEMAAVIGQAKAKTQTQPSTPVSIRRLFGTELPLDEPSGALLPRIC